MKRLAISIISPPDGSNPPRLKSQNERPADSILYEVAIFLALFSPNPNAKFARYPYKPEIILVDTAIS